MPIIYRTASAVVLFLFVGCTETADVQNAAMSPETSDATVLDADSAAAAPAEASVATESPDTTDEPAASVSEYAALPDGLPPQVAEAYQKTTEKAADGGFDGLLSLAGISQHIASQVAESNPDAASTFFKQSATALRAGR